MADAYWASKIGRQKKKLQRGNADLNLLGRLGYLGKVTRGSKLQNFAYNEARWSEKLMAQNQSPKYKRESPMTMREFIH